MKKDLTLEQIQSQYGDNPYWRKLMKEDIPYMDWRVHYFNVFLRMLPGEEMPLSSINMSPDYTKHLYDNYYLTMTLRDGSTTLLLVRGV